MRLGRNSVTINEERIVNEIRSLGIDMINEAGSGHPGIVLGAAPIIYTLYAHYLRINPDNPSYYNRDRFILSAGHGSALLYSTLFMAGFLELDDLKQFRKIDSNTPGHPEVGVTPGVDMTTGPLGQGFATAVGIAITEAHLRSKYNNSSKDVKDLINFNTYVLCGDGDLEEGISYEASSIAGTLGLNKLIVLYDSNDTQLDSRTDKTFSDNIKMRFEACNWNYIKVNDGENINEIKRAIDEAKKSTNKPTLIEIKTTIGKFSKNEGTNIVHGGVLSEEDTRSIKEKLNVRNMSFNPTGDTIEDFRYFIDRRCKGLEKYFNSLYKKLDNKLKEELSSLMKTDKQVKFKNIIYDKPESGIESPRDTSEKILNALARVNETIFGGSADLFNSTKTYVKDGKDYSKNQYDGKNIYFGLRENSMAAIANGIALMGYRPYVSTFLAFSNYMFPAIRLSSMLKLPVNYIFTHDSISLGEDGPTHQPIEQLAQLRAIPDLEVFRPCDANELIGTYKTVMEKSSSPSVISLSKTDLPILHETNSNEVKRGGYVLRNPSGKKLDAIIISTGEEMHQVLNVIERLTIKGLKIRVVSMPCISRFLEQDIEYREEVLPVEVKKIAIEAASSMSWSRLIYNPKYLITLDTFGQSGSREEVYKKFGFDVDSLESRIEELLK